MQAHASGAASEPDAAASPSSAPAVAAAPGERETRVPIKGVRKMTAQAMVGSAFTAPHVTEFVTIDATRTMKLVERLRADREFRDVKVSPLLIVAKAMLIAARRNPQINAAWDEANAGDRGQALREPGHRRGHPARARRAEHQGRAPAVAA